MAPHCPPEPAFSPVPVQIEKLVYGGDGLARIQGQVVLVPFVLPGERVTLSTRRANAGLRRGVVEGIEEASPYRVAPVCEYFGHCGGCHYQHAVYSQQLEQKAAILRETLSRTGGIPFEDEITTISASPWHYRNRIQLHFHDGDAGFRKAGSHDLCGIDHCYISSPTLVDVISKLRAAAREPRWPVFLQSLEIFTNEKAIQLNVVESSRPVAARFFEWCSTFLPGLASGAIDYEAAGYRFRVSSGSFFQVNRFLIEELVTEAIGASSGRSAVDLYAGVGLFSLPLSRRFGVVTAVERGLSAHRDLETNASAANTQVLAIRSTADEFLRTLEVPPDLIIADPPRAGLGNGATAELIRLRPAELVIVSCDPSTLARDLKKLSGAYRIQRLGLVDLFPQTYHFEAVARLTAV